MPKGEREEEDASLLSRKAKVQRVGATTACCSSRIEWRRYVSIRSRGQGEEERKVAKIESEFGR